MTHKFLMFLLSLLIIFLAGCGLTQEEVNKRDDYVSRAQLYFQNQKYLNALQQINLALEIDSQDKRATVSKGWTLFYLKNYEKAQEWFQTALDLDDSDAWTHYGIASVYFRKGSLEFDKAGKLKTSLLVIEEKEEREKTTQTVKKHREQAEHWFLLSLKHYQESLLYDEALTELHKMTALTHVMLGLPTYNNANEALAKEKWSPQDRWSQIEIFLAEGFPHYEKAIESLEKYITMIEREVETTNTLLQEKIEERKKIGLPEKDHIRLDIVIEDLRIQMELRKQKYRTGQGIAAEHCYNLALLMYKSAQQIIEKRALCQEKSKKYSDAAKERIELMLKSDPYLRNAYRNLSKIAELEGNFPLAAEYMQEYIKRYPTGDPKGKVLAEGEYEKLQELAKKP